MSTYERRPAMHDDQFRGPSPDEIRGVFSKMGRVCDECQIASRRVVHVITTEGWQRKGLCADCSKWRRMQRIHEHIHRAR
jgi:hypothetical protein